MIATNFTFLEDKAEIVAPKLLGCILERKFNGQTIRCQIVETEAYDQTDVASHSYKGKTPRTSVMFGPAGHLYVYFTYGMHYCCNIVVGPDNYGAAVLIRAVEPLHGAEYIAENRPAANGIELTNGPAKLCQALLISKTLNGHDLSAEPLKLIPCKPLNKEAITTSTRIGISKGQDLPWRFYIKDNSYVSKP